MSAAEAEPFPSYRRLPRKMRRPAKHYVEHGRIPGDFLQAVLEDSLTRAVGRADSENREYLREYALWLHNDIPDPCWGSRERIEEWHEEGGIEGGALDG